MVVPRTSKATPSNSAARRTTDDGATLGSVAILMASILAGMTTRPRIDVPTRPRGVAPAPCEADILSPGSEPPADDLHFDRWRDPSPRHLRCRPIDHELVEVGEGIVRSYRNVLHLVELVRAERFAEPMNDADFVFVLGLHDDILDVQ